MMTFKVAICTKSDSKIIFNNFDNLTVVPSQSMCGAYRMLPCCYTDANRPSKDSSNYDIVNLHNHDIKIGHMSDETTNIHICPQDIKNKRQEMTKFWHTQDVTRTSEVNVRN